MKLHNEILSNKDYELLKKVAKAAKNVSAYLAGGIGLSLQTGYRRSADFDFFVENEFNTNSMLESLRKVDPKTEPINVTEGTCDVDMSGTQVSFFHYPYKTIELIDAGTDIPDLTLASKTDIACMKLVAIGGRGSRKDFIDLYHIMQDESLNAADLVREMEFKYGNPNNFLYIGMGLSYFDDADQEPMPDSLVKDDWGQIKKFFERFTREFLNECEHRVRILNAGNHE